VDYIKVYHFEKVSSTNEVAKDLAKKLEDDFIVSAEKQTAGRGRKDRSWRSPKGGLYFSLCLPKESIISLKVSVAVVETLECLDLSPSLKWPNDVLLDGKKLCGILVENLEERSVVGVGLNINKAPLNGSTCLNDHVEQSPPTDDLMKSIVRGFYRLEDERVLDMYRNFCETLGGKVRIETPSEDFEATVKDVDERGRLVLEGGKRITAGDVTHLRKKDG